VAGLVGGLMVGLVISFFEEIGWTGLATHELRKRHGLLATGLILGLPWTVMHLPAYTASTGGCVESSPCQLMTKPGSTWPGPRPGRQRLVASRWLDLKLKPMNRQRMGKTTP
jgi:membrane protease YdiL (CAAX protease family)